MEPPRTWSRLVRRRSPAAGLRTGPGKYAKHVKALERVRKSVYFCLVSLGTVGACFKFQIQKRTNADCTTSMTFTFHSLREQQGTPHRRLRHNTLQSLRQVDRCGAADSFADAPSLL